MIWSAILCSARDWGVLAKALSSATEVMDDEKSRSFLRGLSPSLSRLLPGNGAEGAGGADDEDFDGFLFGSSGTVATD